MRYHIGVQRRRARAPATRSRSERSRSPSGFNWISHTFDHADLDGQSYNFALGEFNNNINVANQFALRPFSVDEPGEPRLQRPHHRERDARDVRRRHPLRGRRHLGLRVRQPVAQRRHLQPAAAADPDDPAAADQPLLQRVDARPVDGGVQRHLPVVLGTRSQLRRDPRQRERRARSSTCSRARTIRGCFTRPDLRVYGSGRSLLGDLLDQTFAKYAAARDHAADLAAHGGSRAARRRSHALQRVRRVGHRRSQRQHRHRARRRTRRWCRSPAPAAAAASSTRASRSRR